MAIKMTPELREKLAGLLPMNDNAHVEYTPVAFKDIEELTPVFKIKQFTNGEVSKIKELMYKDSQSKKRSIKDIESSNDEYMKLLHNVLVGWENWVYLDTGEDVAFDGKYETMVKAIPEYILVELYAEAIRITGFLPHGVI